MRPTKTIRVDIPPYQVELHTVAEPDALLDHLVDQSELKGLDLEDGIPYWAELWSSAVAMGRFLAELDEVGRGVKVHELGCGLGLPGVVAGLKGAELTFSDLLPEAVQFAARNWALNLDRPARFATMDWRKPDPALSAELILASDVAYEGRFFDPLCAAFHRLCKPGGSILLSEPGRPMAADFVSSMETRGFRVERHMVDGHWQNLPYQVGICQLWPLGG